MMASLDNILNASDRALLGLRESLPSDESVSVALSIALGRLCAERGISITDVVNMVEVCARETTAELQHAA